MTVHSNPATDRIQVSFVNAVQIVEILDHHHIGSIETRIPVRATFDPVGCTATLITERFRTSGVEPSLSAATMLLGAVLSDTVILNSPTTTDRDQVAIDYLESVVGVDHEAFGRDMFEAGSDVAGAAAETLVTRDCKEYEVTQGSLTIAQVETVGDALGTRLPELHDALELFRTRGGHTFSALMVTDILKKHTHLVVAGDDHAAERAFGSEVVSGIVELPGVMSRKKQVAPPLLGVL